MISHKAFHGALKHSTKHESLQFRRTGKLFAEMECNTSNGSHRQVLTIVLDNISFEKVAEIVDDKFFHLFNIQMLVDEPCG